VGKPIQVQWAIALRNPIVRGPPTVAILWSAIRSSGPVGAGRLFRGEGIAALSGARTAEAIVPAIESDDRYSGVVRREATGIGASRCRQFNREFGDARPSEAVVRGGAHEGLLVGVRERRRAALVAGAVRM
jgi:hypothetical protein